jgi:hypothetical protein
MVTKKESFFLHMPVGYFDLGMLSTGCTGIVHGWDWEDGIHQKKPPTWKKPVKETTEKPRD